MHIVGSTEAPSKFLYCFFLFSDWLNSNHLKSRIERGFLDIFSTNICSAVTETIRVTNYAASFGGKNVQKTKYEAAEMILDPWNQQILLALVKISQKNRKNLRLQVYLFTYVNIYENRISLYYENEDGQIIQNHCF